MKNYWASFFLLISLFGLCFSSPLNGSLVTIVHPDASVTNIDRVTLEKIYEGKTKSWGDGTRVVPVTLKEGGALSNYVKSYFKQSPSNFSTYWKRRVFTGRGTPPKSFSHSADVVEYVGRTPGAIGFIPEEAVGEEVKVIEVK